MTYRFFQSLFIYFFALHKLAHAHGYDKEFDFSVTWGQCTPVGIARESFLINGRSPGPTLHIHEDDLVIVRVHNDSPFNITIHFHGIEMHGTPWSDGVPGLTQTPIDPHSSFHYVFQATQYGSYWYHGHYRGQIEDGLLGAIVIHPRKDRPNMFHLISDDKDVILAMEAAERHVRPLLISDWSRLTSSERWNITLGAHIEIACFDALLLNGKGRIECLGRETIDSHVTRAQRRNLLRVPGASLTDKGCLPPEAVALIPTNPEVTLDASQVPYDVFHGCYPSEGSIEVIRPPAYLRSAEQWVALDIIAATNFIRGAIAIDGHDMYVYAVDGSYIAPQKVQALDFTNGDRYSVLVKADQPGDHTIRVSSTSALQMLIAYATLSVDGIADDHAPKSQAYINVVGEATSPEVLSFDQSKAVPFPPPQLPQSANDIHIINMYQDGATYLWALNTTRLMPDDFEDETPMLLEPDPGARDNVTITTRNGTWVDLVFTTGDVAGPAHPIHKHGNKMYLIGAGTGPFHWSSVDAAMKERPDFFNLVDPLPRDTILTPAPNGEVAWVVARYQVTNPGPWLLHCHINNHMMGGMSMAIQDGIDAWPNYYSPHF